MLPLHSANSILMRYLLQLRLSLCVLGALGLQLARQDFAVSLPMPLMQFVLAVHAAGALLFWWRLRRGWQPDSIDAFQQLFLDVGALTVLLYFSGGVTNPFASLLLLPIALAAALLETRWVWPLVLSALASYLLLSEYNVPLIFWAENSTPVLRQHQFGAAANFVLIALVLAGFVARLTNHLRQSEQELQQLRDTTQRQQQLLGIATMAAGAAHELGSPLTTLNLLLHDALRPDATALGRDDLWLMLNQVLACKETLARLSAAAQGKETEMAEPIDQRLQRTIEHWQALRPQVSARLVIQGETAPKLNWSPLLDQALLSLCNNAADEHPDAITITLSWDMQDLSVTIDDQGRGPSPHLLAPDKQPMFSDKPFGMGLGVWLTNASLECFGGQLSYTAAPGGGTRARLDIPLSRLQAKGEAQS